MSHVYVQKQALDYAEVVLEVGFCIKAVHIYYLSEVAQILQQQS